MSDSNGQLVVAKFEDFMRQCFVLTAAVGEDPSFHYRPAMAQEIFPNVFILCWQFISFKKYYILKLYTVFLFRVPK